MAKTIGAPISVEAAERLLAYLDAMLAENQHINLTAVREREAAVVFHALDSVAMACQTLDADPVHALDIGTGNGFPGVAIACIYPKAKVLLIDRTLKKLKAIERALAAAGFDDGRVTTMQLDAIEGSAKGFKSKFNMITTRAVGPPLQMGQLARPLLAPGGRLLTWLSDDTPAPQTMKGNLCKVAIDEYELPAPANRQRRLVHYSRK